MRIRVDVFAKDVEDRNAAETHARQHRPMLVWSACLPGEIGRLKDFDPIWAHASVGDMPAVQFRVTPQNPAAPPMAVCCHDADHPLSVINLRALDELNLKHGALRVELAVIEAPSPEEIFRGFDHEARSEQIAKAIERVQLALGDCYDPVGMEPDIRSHDFPDRVADSIIAEHQHAVKAREEHEQGRCGDPCDYCDVERERRERGDDGLGDETGVIPLDAKVGEIAQLAAKAYDAHIVESIDRIMGNAPPEPVMYPELTERIFGAREAERLKQPPHHWLDTPQPQAEAMAEAKARAGVLQFPEQVGEPFLEMAQGTIEAITVKTPIARGPAVVVQVGDDRMAILLEPDNALQTAGALIDAAKREQHQRQVDAEEMQTVEVRRASMRVVTGADPELRPPLDA